VCAVIVTTVAFAQSAPRNPNTLRVQGNVERELTLGISDLQRLAVQRVEDVRQIKMAGATGEFGEQKLSYTGVLLRDVLTSAKPVEKQRHDLRRSIVVATATDG
jgi:DMSO/TMAO reductase YedYZ molybdopterin-dependent catalytic subunit